MGTNLVEAWLDAWNSHDGKQLAALMADDGTYQFMATGRVYTSETIADAVAARDSLLSSDYAMTYVSTLHDGDRYATEWEVVGTNDRPLATGDRSASGNAFTIHGSSHGLSQGGRIKLHRDYWDITSLMSQLGLAQSPGVEWVLAFWSEEMSGHAEGRPAP